MDYLTFALLSIVVIGAILLGIIVLSVKSLFFAKI